MVDEIRVCSKCNLNKTYPKEFKGIDSRVCKKCRNLRLKEKRLVNKQPKIKISKEEKLAKIVAWQKRNPDKRKSYIKKYHDSHREQEKEYYTKNREKIISRVKRYVQENKKELNVKLRKRRKDPVIKLRHSVSVLVRHNIRGTKCTSILKYLPYSIDELKQHIEKQFEPWMSWDNWGEYNSKKWDDQNLKTWTWQLDHIVPQSQLIYASMKDENFKKCWALENLRPLSAKQNILNGTILNGTILSRNKKNEFR